MGFNSAFKGLIKGELDLKTVNIFIYNNRTNTSQKDKAGIFITYLFYVYIYVYYIYITYIFPLLSSTSHRPTTHNGVRSSNVTKTGSSWSYYSRIYAEGMRKTAINLSKDSRAEINTWDLQNRECKLYHSILRYDAVLFGNLLRYFGEACRLWVGSNYTEHSTRHTQSYEEVK
jgi:hypothetical protein